jgi:hypothetical protein
LWATAVHNKDPEWSKSSLLVRACACSRRGPQPWVVAAASSRGHLLICCMQPAGSVLRRSLAVCGSSFLPWRSSLCHPPLCGHADQHGGGNMIQVCLLLLGFCLWGSDRHIGSSIRPWWVNAKHAKKATNPPGPHCSSLSCNGWGVRFEEVVLAQADHRGGRSTFRYGYHHNSRRNGAIPARGWANVKGKRGKAREGSCSGICVLCSVERFMGSWFGLKSQG